MLDFVVYWNSALVIALDPRLKELIPDKLATLMGVICSKLGMYSETMHYFTSSLCAHVDTIHYFAQLCWESENMANFDFFW